MDTQTFAARRLGFGLAPGEVLEGDLRDWALAQLSAAPPPLDFYGPAGTNVREKFPDFAVPVFDAGEACKLFGQLEKVEVEVQKQAEDLSNTAFNDLYRGKVFLPKMAYPNWASCLVRCMTVVNGPAPVFERFWGFWLNHFMVSSDNNFKLFYAPYMQATRECMTKSFRDLLHAAILSPAMLIYLDNWLSTGPNSEIGRHTAETINENLARELLELHTVGVTAGYTQADVSEIALALSGWGIKQGYNEHPALKKLPFGPVFLLARHEPGSREILGKTYKSREKGKTQAPELLDDLAADPRTVRFIAAKLARYFIDDEPSAESVEHIVAAWEGSDGDLPTIHAAVVDEVLAKGEGTTKFLPPFDWFLQAHRTTGAELPRARPWEGQVWIDAICQELGQPFNECPQPNGWSDLEEEWLSKELLVRRIRYANLLTRSLRDIDTVRAHCQSQAEAMAGADSPLAEQMRTAPSAGVAIATFLCSPEFMRV